MKENKKEVYSSPEIEFVEFEIEDSITADSASNGSVFNEELWG